ncbi:MAG TPA: hypothetical protein PLH64_08055 [Anaerolineaceae bacterium]|nr:hypothetical protein [Anaerolineaceae bacterium]
MPIGQVGGIYYFRAWQSISQTYEYKTYVFICETDTGLYLLKINSKSYRNTVQFKLLASKYNNVNVITRDSYLDCGRIAKEAITQQEFERLAEGTFRGFLLLEDLKTAQLVVPTAKTLSDVEKNIIINHLQKAIDTYSNHAT